MNDKLKQLIKKASRISLDKKDKDVMRANLLVFVRKSSDLEIAITPMTKMTKWTPVFAGLLILVILGGGVSFAAENALPGELLYPLKLNFNEEVKALTLFSEEGKTDWEARRAERRIEEGEKLFIRGTLNEEKRKTIAEAFARHADRAERGLEKINVDELTTEVKFMTDLASPVMVESAPPDETGFGPEKARVIKIKERLKIRKFETQPKGSYKME